MIITKPELHTVGLQPTFCVAWASACLLHLVFVPASHTCRLSDHLNHSFTTQPKKNSYFSKKVMGLAVCLVQWFGWVFENKERNKEKNGHAGLRPTSFLFPSRRWGRGEKGEKEKKKKRRVLEKMPGQLEASFLIFLTLGSLKQSNTHLDGRHPVRAHLAGVRSRCMIGPGHEPWGIALILQDNSLLRVCVRQGEGEPGELATAVKAKISGEDPRATGDLISNLSHPRVNETKQHGTASLKACLWLSTVMVAGSVRRGRGGDQYSCQSLGRRFDSV